MRFKIFRKKTEKNENVYAKPVFDKLQILYYKSVLTELHNNNMLYSYILFFDLRQHVSLSVWWQLGYC